MLAQLGEDAVVLVAVVTTATCAWFFAAARTIVGPPMSIVSIDGSLEERIEIADDEIDRLDPLAFELGQVLRLRAVGEDPAVDLRVQGLDHRSSSISASR